MLKRRQVVALATGAVLALSVNPAVAVTELTVIDTESESVAPFASVDKTVSVSPPLKLALP